uniref:(northern house mosquito) hypothetical protein n=1 Tax=Culex pipiens TaxID=7175 RepID=A0A8D8B4A0_CULPI
MAIFCWPKVSRRVTCARTCSTLKVACTWSRSMKLPRMDIITTYSILTTITFRTTSMLFSTFISQPISMPTSRNRRVASTVQTARSRLHSGRMSASSLKFQRGTVSSTRKMILLC